MSKLLVRFDKKIKQVMLIEGWEDTIVDDLDKVVVLDDFTFDDIKYTKDTEIKGDTIFFDMRMTHKQLNEALLEYYIDKDKKQKLRSQLIKGYKNGT